MTMTMETMLRIREIWDEIEDEYPEISTEMLTSLTMNRASIEFVDTLDVDEADIAEALIATEKKVNL